MPTTKATSVTEERKHEILMEARNARLSWIQSSTPYKHYDDPKEAKADNDSSATKKDLLSFLTSTRISKQIPSSLPALQTLLNGKPSQEVQSLTREWKDKIQTKQHQQQTEKLVGALDDHAFVFCYQEILERLCLPESMDVVQGMRHFVRSFLDLAKQGSSLGSSPEQNDSNHNSSGGTKTADVELLASTIQKYLNSFYKNIASHPSWSGDQTHETKMMLETFVYSKCHDAIIRALREDNTLNLVKDELELKERLDFLQFVRPSHLEIGCMGEDDCDWKDILSKPIMLLQSLNNMYSPAQMLRCILEIYRGVNDTLKRSLEKGDGEGRMPSADDLLPTLILTIICSKPERIITHLKFLEMFATQEQIRGETGYAFTNLFSATQFIRELSLDTDEKAEGKPSLHIDPVEFQQKLAKFQETVEAKTLQDVKKEDDVNDNSINKEAEGTSELTEPISIPVRELTAARLRGENLDEWAAKWAASNAVSASTVLCTASGEETGQAGDNNDSGVKPSPSLPEGFKRSYQFLATEPDEIRLSDIPALLDEYRMLVKTTEMLLMERNSMASKQHTIEMKNKKEVLNNTLAEAVSTMAKEDVTKN